MHGSGTIRRVAFASAASIAALILLSLVGLPWSAGIVPAADPVSARRFVRGAFHVHTSRSDGAGDVSTVAAAAAAAGLQFVVLTDHGDGTRAPVPPRYLNGVLCLDAVEISTDHGHYVAVDTRQAPYPLGGAGDAVAEDVARLGGFGVAAHPASARESLRWSDESVPVNGVEWLNADSEWRDEGRLRLARALMAYPFRPTAALASLLDRPTEALALWDRLAASRPVLGFAGHDAHGGVGRSMEQPSSRRVPVPSYESSFRTFSTVVELEGALSGDAAQDASAVSDRLRAGRFYTEITSLGRGATLQFFAQSTNWRREQGSVFYGDRETTFSARAPALEGSTIVAYRNGSPVAEASGGSLAFKSSATGSYRVEVHRPGAPGRPPVPWLVSNPIFRHDPPPTATEPPPPGLPIRIPRTAWRAEHDPSSSARVVPADDGVAFEYRLGGGERRSQFAALVSDLSPALPFEDIALSVQAGRPMRLSVQLRFAQDGGARWGRSVYVADKRCTARVSAAALRRIEGAAARPPLSRATSLLLVVDLVNARPGDSGSIHVREFDANRTEGMCGAPLRAAAIVVVH
jgi:hypothetical protein